MSAKTSGLLTLWLFLTLWEWRENARGRSRPKRTPFLCIFVSCWGYETYKFRVQIQLEKRVETGQESGGFGLFGRVSRHAEMQNITCEDCQHHVWCLQTRPVKLEKSTSRVGFRGVFLSISSRVASKIEIAKRKQIDCSALQTDNMRSNDFTFIMNIFHFTLFTFHFFVVPLHAIYEGRSTSMWRFAPVVQRIE